MLRDPDLPDALYALEGEAAPAYQRSQEAREARLASLGQVIAGKRDLAVRARKDSGIEGIWTAAEEAYLGIDECNRSQFGGSRWAKPTSSAGPLTQESGDKPGNKSTVFIPLTARYVDMAFAKTSGIVLSIDEKSFSIGPTQIPDLAGKLADQTQATDAAGQPAQDAKGQPVTRGQLLQQQVDAAKARAKKEEDWIYDNWQESKHPQEMRKVLFDMPRLGTGCLKGPIPTEIKAQSFSVENGAGKLKIVKKIAPGLAWFDIWNLFPAPGCGENIHDGDHLLERDFFTERKLKSLKSLKDQFGAPLYLPEQIDKVIAEGPGKVNEQANAETPKKQDHKNHFELWNYYGALTAQDMRDMGAPGVEDLPDDLMEVHAVVTLVNDTVIRATINPLESGRFPHRVAVWQRRSGYWAGVGVGERIEVPQKMINGATRAMMNNAGKSAGSQIVVDSRAIEPADGSWDLNTGDKVWRLTGESLHQDLKQIFLTYTVPNLTPALLTIVDYALKLAEECTNLPLVAQGQTGKDDPETFGQAELQNNNANELLRSIAWNVDDSITEPLVQDYHEWYLLDPDIPDEDKGDFEINARGSIAMVERAIQEQTYGQMLELSLNPTWGQDPKKMFAQFLRTKRLNPEDTAYSEADLQRIQQTPPPPPPQVQVAQVNAAAKLHVVEMQGQQSMQEIQAEAQVAGGTDGGHGVRAAADVERERIKANALLQAEGSRANAEAARAEKELEIAQVAANASIEELRMKRELALLDYASKHNLTLMQVKGQLANTALQIQAERELQGADHQLQQAEGEAQRGHEVDKHDKQLEADAAAAKLAAKTKVAAAKKTAAKPAAKKAKK